VFAFNNANALIFAENYTQTTFANDNVVFPTQFARNSHLMWFCGALIRPGTDYTMAGVAAFIYTYTIIGASASGETATATYRLRVTGDISDTGPGGGVIFYYLAAGFSCGPTRAATCKYLEAAPPAFGLATFDSDTANTTSRTWAQNTPVNYQLTTVNNATSPETATATALGWGYRNTRAIILQGNTNPATSAAALADSHTVTVSGVVYDDWFLPSKDELNQMCKWARGITGALFTSLTTACSGGTINTGSGAAGFAADFYWSSTENDSFSSQSRRFTDGSGAATNKRGSAYVRAIRAF
jgi:hypothetical protein